MTQIYHEQGSYFGNNTEAHVDFWDGITSSMTHYGNLNPVTSIFFSKSVGYTTADYRKLRDQGSIIPFSDWTQQFTSGEVKEGDFRIDFPASGGSYQTNHGLLPIHLIDTSAWLAPRNFSENSLYDYDVDMMSIGKDQVQKAAASIYSSGWDGLTWAAELHKVAGLFKSFVRKWAGIEPRKLHEMWLEGRYGWRLLMYDIRDINELIANIDVERTRFKKKTGTGGSERIVTNEVLNYYDRISFFLTHTDEIVWSIRGNIVADITGPTKVQINPVTTAWELVTFSFVLDWIIDIGQWLEAMSFLLVSSNYTAAVGLQASWVRTSKLAGITWDSSMYTNIEWNFEAECTTTYTRRIPTRVSLLPTLGLDLNVWKVVDLLALLAKFFKFR